MKNLYVPKRADWCTYTSTEDGSLEECTYLGGYGVLSTGKWEPPITVIYAFLPDNLVRGEVVLVEDTIDNWCSMSDALPNPVHPDRLSVVHLAYDPEAANEATDEDVVVQLANEYQGGEADTIDYVRDTPLDEYKGVKGHKRIYLGEFQCNLDDHDTAIQYLVGKAQEWIAQQ